MCLEVAVVHNEPSPSRYDIRGEEKAESSLLDEVAAVSQALTEAGYHVVRVPLSPPLEQVREKIESLKVDLVFNLFEGFCGYPETEAGVPEILAELGIPYTGCPASALSLALDKAQTKIILQAAGIDTPDFQLLNLHNLHMFQLTYPCIVKPRREDASHGMSEESVVYDFTALDRQVRVVSDYYGGSALVEEFVGGREFNATVFGNADYTVLPVSEIDYELPPGLPEILTFAAKWEPDSRYFRGTRVVCPARLTLTDQEHITEIAQAAFRLLGCRGYARVDMRLDGEGRLNVIEVNPNPDISPDTGAARQALASGMTYTQFIEKIAALALGEKLKWQLKSAS